ncbi:MAG: hypothetical protein JXC33_07320 [Deltaproteobacteria bacterium]|nr:hypothetical protein [Deltaproteobacteria bacterium]
MEHITRLTAVVILTSFTVVCVSLLFVRRIMLKMYMNMAGTEYCLPVPTTFAVNFTSTISLSVIFIIVLSVLGVSEYSLKKERQRFLVQIGSVTLLMLFLIFLMLAFALPMYIPDLIIVD